MVGIRDNPYLSFRFLVEFQGLLVGGFSEVSGLQAETETEEIQEGGVNDHVHKLPKITRHQNIILKRGMTDSETLWRWHNDVVHGNIVRETVYITLRDNEGNDVWQWSFDRAYPVKWTGPELRADSSTVAIEALELVHDGIK